MSVRDPERELAELREENEHLERLLALALGGTGKPVEEQMELPEQEPGCFGAAVGRLIVAPVAAAASRLSAWLAWSVGGDLQRRMAEALASWGVRSSDATAAVAHSLLRWSFGSWALAMLGLLGTVMVSTATLVLMAGQVLLVWDQNRKFEQQNAYILEQNEFLREQTTELRRQIDLDQAEARATRRAQLIAVIYGEDCHAGADGEEECAPTASARARAEAVRGLLELERKDEEEWIETVLAVFPWLETREVQLVVRSWWGARVDLSYAPLDDAPLREIDFAFVDLQMAQLRRANLEHASLRQADLNGAQLEAAHLGSADLNGAVLKYADLSHAYLLEASVVGADLRHTNMEGTTVLETMMWEERARDPASLRVKLLFADLTDSIRHARDEEIKDWVARDGRLQMSDRWSRRFMHRSTSPED